MNINLASNKPTNGHVYSKFYQILLITNMFWSSW